MPTTTTTTWTIDDIRLANRRAGQHFFSPDTIRFFRSRIGTVVHQGPGGVYFTTSEQFWDSHTGAAPRRWTVRSFHPATGWIGTVGAFNTLGATQARRLAANCAAGLVVAE